MNIAADVRRFFTLDPDEGLLRWAIRRKGATLGAVAGVVAKDGRRRIGFFGDTYLAHRLIWLHVHGEWPKHEIDHIDGDVTNNRPANLRDVPHAVNAQNKRRPTKQNALGVQGVILEPSGAYSAYLTTAGKGRRLGTFQTVDAASAAYLAAKRAAHEGCTL